MKRCASCGREIAESATVCDLCERWAADHIQPTPAAASPAMQTSLDDFDSLPTSPETFESAPRQSVAVPHLPAPSQAPIAAMPQPAAKSGLSRRELMIIGGAVALGSVLTFALVGSRGGASTTVAAANRVPANSAGAPAPAAPEPAATQVWSTARRGYWTANQHHSAAFELPAENTVAIWMNYVRPILVVRCMGKRTEAFVYTGSALKIEPNTEDHGVTFRFDNEAGRSEHWPDSAEHDALFAPDGAGFAHRILSAKTLRFGYTPHNAEPAEAHFHVDGLEQLIDPAAAKDCGWQK